MAWRSALYRLVRPVLFRFEPERIHGLTLDALHLAGINPAGRAVASFLGGAPRDGDPVEIAGIRFRTRVGVAAGFDKDGVALRGWAALGLGFAEVGTVTPLPQGGNRRPRLFRLPADQALINRMGFNNAGAAAVARNVMLARRHLPPDFVVGINLGRGRHTPDERAIDDYCAAHRLSAPVADYLVINVSSPNTPGLRDLQDPARLQDLLHALAGEGDRLRCRRPLFVKLAPDLPRAALDAALDALTHAPAAGVILANSSLERRGLHSDRNIASEQGGLSGAPLLPRVAQLIGQARERVGGGLAIMASGGIHSAEDAVRLREAGADLVQLWTGLVYRGPGLVGDTTRALRSAHT
jgi:dihydroorotate dehydrogenase